MRPRSILTAVPVRVDCLGKGERERWREREVEGEG